MMACFSACFGASKRRRHIKSVIVNPSANRNNVASGALPPTETTKQEVDEIPINPITESNPKLEEQSSCSVKKKVTFDLDVRTHEDLSTKELTDNLVISNEEREDDNEESPPKEAEFPSSVAPSMSFHSPNHRCENCIENDDDYGDEDLEDDNLDDHEKKGEDVEGSVNQASVQEESSESLFSLSIDSRRQVSAVEKAENEVNSPIPVLDYCYSEEEAKEIGSSQNDRDRIQSVCSVLNPIENLSEWKVVKATVTQPVKHQAKENINSEQGFDIPSSPEPNLKVASCYSKSKSSPLKHQEHEIGVDTSLSSWLIESETTPKSKNSTTSVGNSPSKGTSSPMSREDRPILGALTIEELRLFSASTTPRRTRHRSPDETPIIGTVGSYWSHTGQATDSDSSSSCSRMPNRGTRDREALGKDRRVKWNSTQFKARLDVAFDMSNAEA